jgi:riboflavin synthase
MFTGIVETTGEVLAIRDEGTNKHFTIKPQKVLHLHEDQSVSHDGVCLTVTHVEAGHYQVTAVEETLKKSKLMFWKQGDRINLERCMEANGRFDGHIVQGHVDQTGICTHVEELEGSWLYDFEYDPEMGNVTVEKGSITVNGVSLTCFNSAAGKFRVTIIPYTFEHTNFSDIHKGDRVNLEFDIVGKYVRTLLEGYKS